MQSPYPVQFVQTGNQLLMLFEYMKMWRMIYTDGREHLKAAMPPSMGDSVGNWEGDTLVIDTAELNDRTWLDTAGHQHRGQLHVIERLWPHRPRHDCLRDHGRCPGDLCQALEARAAPDDSQADARPAGAARVFVQRKQQGCRAFSQHEAGEVMRSSVAFGSATTPSCWSSVSSDSLVIWSGFNSSRRAGEPINLPAQRTMHSLATG
jgi:hypothetical protein